MRAALAADVTAAVAASVPGSGAGVSAAERPVVTAAVQVTRSPDPARAYASPQIVRNPVTGELVIAATEVRTLKTVEVFPSTDYGRSWDPAGDPMLKPWTDSSGDPEANVNQTLAFDNNGILYVWWMQWWVNAEPTSGNKAMIASSSDGGRTFGAPVQPARG